jgi:hypothetical protein
MEQLFLDLVRRWEDNPVPVDEANQIKTKLIKPLEDLVEAIEANASNAEIYSLTNKLVSAYLI